MLGWLDSNEDEVNVLLGEPDSARLKKLCQAK